MEHLTDKAISPTPPRMGRPPLNVEATTVRLPRDVLKRIDALAGPNRRAQFIREAVETELAKREKAKPE